MRLHLLIRLRFQHLQPELLTNLRDADRLILDGDHDVFGDGRFSAHIGTRSYTRPPSVVFGFGMGRTIGAIWRPVPFPH
ncbi:MAG: hypothetical protein Ct9H300mP25_07930 [Acidobacteriota bacterium]|nr:MAG: hypothetical protein Ct9H300mP25_07930 [Acidobacteriota bacterium]